MRKFILLLFLLSLAYSCGIHRKVDFLKGSVGESVYYETIPYKSTRHKIILPVTLKGDTFHFLLDTGSPTLISSEVQDKFNFPVLTADTITDIHQTKQHMKIVQVDNLKLGDVRFDGTPALVGQLDQLPWCCFEIDGFIGSNLLRNSVIRIDPWTKSFSISHDIREFNHRTMASKNLRIDWQGSPFLKIDLNEGHAVEFLFDTGSDDFVNISNRDFEIYRKKFPVQIEQSGYGSSKMGLFGKGEENHTYKIKLDSIVFCNQKILDPMFRVSDTRSKIGSRILDYGAFILDYQQEKFYFEKATEPLRYEAYSESNLGFLPVLNGNQFQVGVVWKNSFADSLNLKPGQQIVRVNEYDFTDDLEPSFCDIFINGTLRSADTLNITFQAHDGSRKRIQLIRK